MVSGGNFNRENSTGQGGLNTPYPALLLYPHVYVGCCIVWASYSCFYVSKMLAIQPKIFQTKSHVIPTPPPKNGMCLQVYIRMIKPTSCQKVWRWGYKSVPLKANQQSVAWFKGNSLIQAKQHAFKWCPQAVSVKKEHFKKWTPPQPGRISKFKSTHKTKLYVRATL